MHIRYRLHRWRPQISLIDTGRINNKARPARWVVRLGPALHGGMTMQDPVKF